MAIEKVREYFSSLGIEDKIKEFDVSSATVELAAIALGCEGARIAKTMSFALSDGDILIVAAGDVKIDNHKFKEEFHQKAKMLPFDQCESRIGHAAGGVCPFAVNDGVKVYLDESMKRFEIVYPAAGSASSAVELTIKELEQYSGYEKWVDVCKPREENI